MKVSVTTARHLIVIMFFVAVMVLFGYFAVTEDDPVAAERTRCERSGGVALTVTASSIDRKRVVCFPHSSIQQGTP